MPIVNKFSKCCYSWTPIQKKGEIRLWQGGVHEAQKTWSLRFTLEVFIWVHVVYVPKLSTTFRGILICVIVRPRDMKEYILMFSIALELRCKYKYYTIWWIPFTLTRNHPSNSYTVTIFFHQHIRFSRPLENLWKIRWTKGIEEYNIVFRNI
jgi:hypothetical protein